MEFYYRGQWYKMNNSWFDDIYNVETSVSYSEKENASKKRNIRYTPSANQSSAVPHILKRKRSPRVIENGNWAPIPRICQQNAKSACIVNPEEVDEFLNLLSELIVIIIHF